MVPPTAFCTPPIPSGLPRILCLHGAGTNGRIFQFQARAILQSLGRYFTFTFVDAPFESLPGPGVLPTYAGMKPYLWWHCDDASAGFYDIKAEEIQRRRQVVRELLAQEMNDASIVGIMAFSQGARLATSMCLDHEFGPRFKFAILIAATFPALDISTPHPPPPPSHVADTHSLSDPNVLPERLAIPSVHVQGSHDPWLAQGKKLREVYFEEGQTTVVKFSGGHACPSRSQDAERIAKAVRNVWGDSSAQ